jgi:ABC-2 type transport system ATP-binding protein
MPREYAIEVSNLTKRYGELLAVDHISFLVKCGEIFGFLGPNGAGKTTTVRMLTGVIRPDNGVAKVMGYDIQKEPIRAKQVMGIVPEMSNAYVDLSAWDNLMFIGELYGVPEKERRQRAESLLKDFGLLDRRKQLVKGFSKGMKQRLILCMALINEPQVLFLDEPTSGLDVESARIIKDVIRDLNRMGVTVFLTTHNMDEANQLCDRVAIINHGKIIAVDTPERLRARSSGLQSVEVSFDKPINLRSLSSIPAVLEVVKTGDKVKLYTSDPGAVIPYITDFVRSNNLKIVSMSTLAPSLEDVFVKLVKESPMEVNPHD